jgi:ferric-dicitrate binding protein FerR (iron transport regulator)
MYLDFPPAALGAQNFIVQTKAGFVEHQGTQFEVVVDGEVRVRVREGVVQFHRPAGIETAEAGVELVVPVDGPVERHVLATHGREWSWMESLAPEYEIEDRPLIDFLQWVARETGRQLDFADDRAREVAARTRLHGSVDGLVPLEALTHVLSTTTLRFELRGDAIRISTDQ